jgi:hypothetical protein
LTDLGELQVHEGVDRFHGHGVGCERIRGLWMMVYRRVWRAG